MYVAYIKELHKLKFEPSGHSSQKSQGRMTSLSHKQKLNTFLPSFSSPTEEIIFVFMLLCVKV